MTCTEFFSWIIFLVILPNIGLVYKDNFYIFLRMQISVFYASLTAFELVNSTFICLNINNYLSDAEKN